MILQMSSGLFNLKQPCIYWEFSSHIEGVEESETYYYNDNKEFHEPNGNMFVDGAKARVRLSKHWLELFSLAVDMRLAKIFGTKGMLSFVYDKPYSPKEYNFGGDRCYFDVILADKVFKKLCKYALSMVDFEAFLAIEYKSYDGFMSFMPQRIPCFKEAMENDKERALAAVLQYLVFLDDEHRKEFNDEFLYSEDIEFYEDIYFEVEELRGCDTDDVLECALCGAIATKEKPYTMYYSIGYDRYACERCACKVKPPASLFKCINCGKTAEEGVEPFWAYHVGDKHWACRDCFVKFRTEEWQDNFVAQEEELPFNE